MIRSADRLRIRLPAHPVLPGWSVVPLRLFLGGSFLAAGLDKLTDPAFLDPGAPGYLGRQIAGFAPGTPLEGFLLQFALPNATLFGVLVMGGELCIAVAVLLGLLTRFSALMGMLLNLTFFLSATWLVRPFYFGADLPYAAAWLTLALTGPGPLALDPWIRRRWLAPRAARGQAVPARGTLLTRRAFLGAGAAGLAGLALAATGLGWGVLHPRRAEALRQAPVPTPTPAAKEAPAAPSATAVAGPAATPTTTPGARRLLASAGTLAEGAGQTFTLAGGTPAILLHQGTSYRAFVTRCTHAACTVELSNGRLVCPCHGAVYDPAADGAVVAGPAPLPLPVIPLQIDPGGNVYLLEV
jgi:thiosulfate dehydrogenase [quinone] large subunit